MGQYASLFGVSTRNFKKLDHTRESPFWRLVDPKDGLYPSSRANRPKLLPLASDYPQRQGNGPIRSKSSTK